MARKPKIRTDLTARNAKGHAAKPYWILHNRKVKLKKYGLAALQK